MDFNVKRITGLLFIVSVVQFIFATIICESVYSGYSVGQQVVSDLGNWNLAGNYSAIFNISIILMGILIIVGAYFIQRIFKSAFTPVFMSLGVLLGVGYIGVGVFAENISRLHNIFALIMFVFGAIFAIMSYKFVKSPFSHVSIILGVTSLLAYFLWMLGLQMPVFHLGLGIGGMERLILYPILLWVLSFGAYLIGDQGNIK